MQKITAFCGEVRHSHSAKILTLERTGIGKMLILKLKTNDRVRISAKESGRGLCGMNLTVMSVGSRNVRVGFESVSGLADISLVQADRGKSHVSRNIGKRISARVLDADRGREAVPVFAGHGLEMGSSEEDRRAPAAERRLPDFIGDGGPDLAGRVLPAGRAAGEREGGHAVRGACSRSSCAAESADSEET